MELIFEGLTPQVTPQVSPQVVNLLKGIGEDTLSKAEMMEKMHLTDRKSFGRLYLQPALTQGLIEMTIPDKPQSRLQRYRLSELGSQVQNSETDKVDLGGELSDSTPQVAPQVTPQVVNLLKGIGEGTLSKAEIMKKNALDG